MDIPLAVLVGGEIRPLPAYDSFGMLDPLTDLAWLEASVASGFKAIKIKLGAGDVASDVALVAELRRTIGDGVRLMLDFNQSQSTAGAVERIRRLRDFDLTWVEEPVAAEDLAGHRAVRERVRPVPIQTGENWWFPHGMPNTIAAGASDPSAGPAAASRLEPQTQAFLDRLARLGGPPIYTLSPADARNVYRSAQNIDVLKPPADIEDRSVPGGPGGDVSVRVIRPRGAGGPLPAVVYVHGGGWGLGDKDTHDRLVRELAVGANAAVVFVNYTPSPEAKFPAAYFCIKAFSETDQTEDLRTWSRFAEPEHDAPDSQQCGTPFALNGAGRLEPSQIRRKPGCEPRTGFSPFSGQLCGEDWAAEAGVVPVDITEDFQP